MSWIIGMLQKLLKFGGCGTEVELILVRHACFQTPTNIWDITIYLPCTVNAWKMV